MDEDLTIPDVDFGDISGYHHVLNSDDNLDTECHGFAFHFDSNMTCKMDTGTKSHCVEYMGGYVAEESKGRYVLKKKTALASMELGAILPESHLALRDKENLYQFEYHSEPEQQNITIEPGNYNLVQTNQGIKTKKFEWKPQRILESIDNTKMIFQEIERFQRKVKEGYYVRKEKPPKRGVLLASPPGIGKTAAINQFCNKLQKADDKTCIIVWDTASIRADDVSNYFMNYTKFKDVSMLVLILEDIGGKSVDGDMYSRRESSSSMLNFLGGVGNAFKSTPTFIIATTNNPEEQTEALIRPGRLDKVLTLKAPGIKETRQLIQFFDQKDLTESGEKAAKIASENKFSISFIEELVDRSELEDISLEESAKELAAFKKKVKDAFIEKGAGVGLC